MNPTERHDFNIGRLVWFQYFFDASEAEAWMSEQELYMISEDRARDEMGATNMLKKHGNMEKVVDDYADVIRQLGERSRKFLDDNHPDRFTYKILQPRFQFHHSISTV